MVLAAAGCSGSDAGNSQASDGNTPSAENGGSGTSSKDTLIIANTAGEPGNLHPYNTVSIGARLPQYMVFDGLIELDTSGKVQPGLAESWEADEKQITFHLREGVTFHNGEKMTAEDVVFFHSGNGQQFHWR